MNSKREQSLLDVIAAQQARIESLTEQLETMHFRVNQMSRRIYGNVSERFIEADDQLHIPGLLGDGFTTPLDTEQTNAAEATPQRKPCSKKRQAAKPGGRMKIPDNVPVKEITLEPEQTVERITDQTLVKLRTETTEKLDYVAGGFQKLIIHRPVYGSPENDGMTICADPIQAIVPKGLPTDRTVAMVLCEKYDLHNPLYRQSSRFDRAGISIGRATLMNWLTHAAHFLKPVTDAMTTELLNDSVLHLDDTTVKRLTPGSGATKQCYFWGYLSSQACIVQYSNNRSGRNPADFLRTWSGTVVADHFSGHEALYDPMKNRGYHKTHAPCLLHVRRKFYDAWKDGGDLRAQPILHLFKKLYQIEEQCREFNLHQRQERRQQDAQPILEEMNHLIISLRDQCTPKSPLGRACTYFLNLSERIPTYLADGRIPIDNNALERLWKPIALGRKNYLFVGNDDGGDRSAIFYTITLTCKMHGIDPYAYLLDVIPKLHRQEDPTALTPSKWAQRKFSSHNIAA